MRILKRVLKIGLVVVLVLVVSVGGLFGWLVVRGMPQRDGVAHVPGLGKDVRVVRDQYGIPNIYASTTEDLFAAQGWIHASERMWQMEVWRRIGAGRLSELFGDSTLANDEFIRTLGWRQAAENDWAAMPDEGKKAVQAYANGVNAWIDAHGDMPLPFVIAGFQGAGGGLAGYHPEHWTPIDTLTWQKVQAWSLGDNYGSELARAVMLNRGLTTAQIDQLNPPYDPTRPVIASQSGYDEPTVPTTGTIDTDTAYMPSTTASGMLAAADSLRAELALAGAGPALAGSNGSVVAPSLSATGGALLGNDPHLDISMPSVWYLAGLHCEPVGPACPYDEAGAGFPGVPGLVLGHNDRIAWGLTNVGPDVQDVFEETVDPADPTHYLYKGQSLPFDVRHETVHVSGGDDVQMDVRSTVHGPVMSDIDAVFKPTTDPDGAGVGQPGHVYTLDWTATAQADKTLDAVLGVNRAQNWDDFRNALRDFGGPSQTFLYADIDGNIGVEIPGLIPMRDSGDGQYIVSGDDGAHDWQGFVPFDQLPYVYNPANGLIVASNNQPAPLDSNVFLGKEFDPGWRAMRIHELLDPQGKLGGSKALITTDMLRSVQGDVALTRAAPVIAALPDITASTPDGEALRLALITWGSDLSCTTDSTGCAGYEDFEYWLERGVFADELGDGTGPTDAASRYVGTETAHEFLTRLIGDPSSPWWDDTTTTTTTETRNEVIAAALDKAATDLKASLGSDPSKWTWGRIHTATFQEQTLGMSGIGPLEWIFNKGPYPAPGSCTTVFKVCGDIANDWPTGDQTSDLQSRFAAASSPSYRLVVDMKNLDAATIIQTTGQSGVPFDSHYGDFIERWLANEPLPLPWTDDAVNATTKQTLTLSP